MVAFSNQYILTRPEPSTLPDSFAGYGSIAGYTIRASTHLSVAVHQDDRQEVAILGDIYDPHRPAATNDTIAQQVLARPPEESVFETLQQYTGRYVAVYADEDTAAIIPDATCNRRIQFTDGARVVTSSPKLFLDAFGLESDTAPDVVTFTESERFGNNAAAWPGKRTIDRRLTRVLPNHYLDVEGAAVARRRPLSQPPISDREGAIDYISDTLTGSLAAIAERYNDVRIGLSAGWDSRAVLAAAADIEDEVTFFTSLASIDLDHSDVQVSHALAERFDLDYRTVRPRTLTDAFVATMKANYLNPRLTDGERIIQHYWRDGDPSETAVIGGNGGEIIRAYYPVPLSVATPDLLADLYGYRDSTVARDAFADWLAEAEPYAEAAGINIFDLFYWEQRMGNWAARRAYEQDIAANGFSPFNNYNLLLAGLSISRSERKGEECPLFVSLIEDLRPKALAEPVNPTEAGRGQQLKKRLKQTTRTDSRLYRMLRHYRAIRT